MDNKLLHALDALCGLQVHLQSDGVRSMDGLDDPKGLFQPK